MHAAHHRESSAYRETTSKLLDLSGVPDITVLMNESS